MASEVVCGLVFRLLLPLCLAAGESRLPFLPLFVEQDFCVESMFTCVASQMMSHLLQLGAATVLFSPIHELLIVVCLFLFFCEG